MVTGAASGLGEATARLLAARGGRVLLIDANPAGESIASELGANSSFIQADVTNEMDGIRTVTAATERYGAVHGLVNCAGISPSAKVVGRNGAHDLAEFTRVVMINLVGTFNMLRLAAEAMISNEPQMDGERGVIINTASIAAYEGQIGQAAYAASKAGVVGLTLPAARELASSGVRVVTIAPGLFMTPMMASFPVAVQESLARSVPFPQRLGNPSEFAELVETIFVLRLFNGETLRLDGALRMAAR